MCVCASVWVGGWRREGRGGGKERLRFSSPVVNLDLSLLGGGQGGRWGQPVGAAGGGLEGKVGRAELGLGGWAGLEWVGWVGAKEGLDLRTHPSAGTAKTHPCTHPLAHPTNGPAGRRQTKRRCGPTCGPRHGRPPTSPPPCPARASRTARSAWSSRARWTSRPPPVSACCGWCRACGCRTCGCKRVYEAA